MTRSKNRQNRRRGWVLGLVAAVVLSVSAIAIATAGAVTSGQQVPGTALAESPFTAGTPFASGQTIEVKVAANTIFNPSLNVQIQECQALPGGLPPTDITKCDGLTTYPATNLPNADGSFDITNYTLYSLPNSGSLGETPSSAVHCDLANACVLYIGNNAQDFTQPHIWSQAFSVSPVTGDTGVPAGDGSASAFSTTPVSTLSSVSAVPTTAVADGAESSTVTVKVLGKNASNATAPVTPGTAVTLAQGSGHSTISSAPPASAVTDSTGTATFTVKDTTAEPVTYSATALSVALGTTHVTFATPVVSPTASSVAAAPTAVASDGTTKSTITVTVKDQAVAATPLAGKVVSLAANAGNQSVITIVSATTDSSGVATFTVTDSHAELVTYTATVGSVQITKTASVTFGTLLPTAADSTVIASPSTVTIGAGGTTVTVTLLTGATPVAGKTVSLAKSPSTTAVISPLTGVSDSNGQVAFNVTDANAEPVIFTATDTTDSVTITQTATVTFQQQSAPVPSPTLSTAVAPNPTVVADGTTSVDVVVTVRDTATALLAGKTIHVTPTQPNVKVTITPIVPSGTGVAGVTGADGQATFQIRDTVAETVPLTVVDTTDNNMTIIPNPPLAVTFTPGPVDGSQSGIAASPSAVAADGTSSSAITVTLADHFGNPVAGKTVSLLQGGGHSSITPSTAVTTSKGTATFTATDKTSEYVVYGAVDVDDGNLGVSTTTKVTFGTPPPILPVSNDSTIVSNTSSVPADGQSTATITVLLYDGNGLPVAGRTVALKPSVGTSVITGTATTSDPTGAATFTVADAKVESVTYTASDTSDSVPVTGSVTISFTATTATTSTAAASSSGGLNKPIVGMAATPDGGGYWLVASDGGIFTFGDARFRGSTGSLILNKPIVGMAATPDGGGYWLVASDGGIFTFGDARFRGSTGDLTLNKPIVGMTVTPDGGGYFLVASDGGIFTFGDAHFQGSTGSMTLNMPIVGMAVAPDGGGYWLVASDGGIFTFGDAVFQGSTGSMILNRPIVGMAVTPDGGGYFLVASDGGMFTFGNGHFHGSTGSMNLNKPIVGMAANPDGGGYWLAASDGGIFNFGDSKFVGSAA